MADTTTYKTYQTRKKTLIQELEKLKRKSSTVNRKIIDKKRAIERVERQIANITLKKVIISEHAILRYLERVQGIDIEGIKGMILSNTRIENAIITCGTGTYPIQGGRIKVVNNIITTVITN